MYVHISILDLKFNPLFLCRCSLARQATDNGPPGEADGHRESRRASARRIDQWSRTNSLQRKIRLQHHTSNDKYPTEDYCNHQVCLAIVGMTTKLTTTTVVSRCGRRLRGLSERVETRPYLQNGNCNLSKTKTAKPVSSASLPNAVY